MALTDNLRRQHAELLKMAGEISAVAVPKDAAQVNALLSKMTGLIRVHLAMEDKSMYPAMMIHKDTTIRDLARRFQAEMGGLAAAYLQFAERWATPEAIEAAPKDFTRTAGEVFGALAKRIQREDKELYPLVDKAGL